MWMAASCCVGPDETGSYCRGGSNITDPSGDLLEEIWDREGIVVRDVDPEVALVQRQKNPWFVGQRQDLYR